MKNKSQVEIAVIATGGKQHLVKVGDKVKVAKLTTVQGEKIELKDLLDGKTVKAQVGLSGKHKKVSGRIFINKVRSSRFPHGHRQDYTELEILEIA